MKNLKTILGISVLSVLILASCNKEQVEPNIQPQETRIESITDNQFDNSSEEELQLLNALINGEDIEANQFGPSITKTASCAVAVTSLTYNPAPFPPYFANLNVQYTVNAPTQHVRIKHWKKSSTGSYVYQGESGVSTNATECTDFSVNQGSQFFSEVGEYISWARMYDGTSYMGSYQFLVWEHI